MHLISTASEGAEALSEELFRARLDALIDLSHLLAKLTRTMPWAEIEGTDVDCLLRRKRFKGAHGDVLHVLACAAGYKLRWCWAG